MGQQQEPEGLGPRTIYFNVPLPPEARSEEGHIKAQYARNKIRTAKYTALSFVPKNLWFQFHNIANVYFFFIIILSVSISNSPFRPFSDLVADFLYIWSLKSRSGFRALDLHLDCDCDQGCCGGFRKNCAGHRAQQLASISPDGLGKRQLFHRRCWLVEKFQKGLHPVRNYNLSFDQAYWTEEVQSFGKEFEQAWTRATRLYRDAGFRTNLSLFTTYLFSLNPQPDW